MNLSNSKFRGKGLEICWTDMTVGGKVNLRAGGVKWSGIPCRNREIYTLQNT